MTNTLTFSNGAIVNTDDTNNPFLEVFAVSNSVQQLTGQATVTTTGAAVGDDVDVILTLTGTVTDLLPFPADVIVNLTGSGTVTYLGQSQTGELLLSGTIDVAGTATSPFGVFDISETYDDETFFLTDATNLQTGDPLPLIVTTPLVCFAAGTRIATPEGEVAVEALTRGDTVLCADGSQTEIRWIGRQTIAHAFRPAERPDLIRISAGALAHGVPVRDLVVTADHGVVVDGVIIHAAALVNGLAIAPVPRSSLPTLSTVYHVETAGHAVILAEGTPVETFVDNVTRAAFDNHAEFVALYGDVPAEMEPLDLPRAKGPRQVPAEIRDHLAARAAELCPAVA